MPKKRKACIDCIYYRPVGLPDVYLMSNPYCSNSKSEKYNFYVIPYFYCNQFVRDGEKAPKWMLLLLRFIKWLNKQLRSRGKK